MVTNTLPVISDLAEQILAEFMLNLGMSATANTSFAEYFSNQPRIGDTIRIFQPLRVSATNDTGGTFSAQDTVLTTSSLVLANNVHVDLQFTDQQLAMYLPGPSEFNKQIIKPAATALVSEVERVGETALSTACYMTAGTINTAIGSITPITQADAVLALNGVPNPQYILMNPVDGGTLRAGLQAQFAPSMNDDIAKYNKFGVLDGKEVVKSSLPFLHTAGAQGGTPLVDGASQTGTTLDIKGASNSITGWAKKGDIIQIAGIYSVDPVTHRSTGILSQQVVTADANSSGTGTVSLSIFPGITPTTAQATVTASPADEAAITFLTGTANKVSRGNFMYHQDGLCLGWVKLISPQGAGAESYVASDPQSPVNIRISRQWAIEGLWKYKIEVQIGWLINPEYICRILGPYVS